MGTSTEFMGTLNRQIPKKHGTCIDNMGTFNALVPMVQASPQKDKMHFFNILVRGMRFLIHFTNHHGELGLA